MSGRAPDASEGASGIWSRPFMLLCLSHALFTASFNMIIPELPAYLAGMGGAEYKGYIIALFTLTAGVSRPFSGKLTDTIGRVPVMFIGTLACVVCGMFYPVLHFVMGFLALRLLHGFSTGFKPTATVAYVADVVPVDRRGEAMGILGICFSVGASAAPPVGSFIARQYGTDWMFYASVIFALLSIVILFNMPETLREKRTFSLSLLRVGKEDIFDPRSIPAAIVMLFCYLSYGAILTVVPDQSDALGIGNRGMFFSVFTLASVSTRLVAGKVSDRVGRVPVLKVSAWVIALGMVILGYAHTPWMFYLGSFVFGLGNGIFSPAINAWTVDLGDPNQRGRALATMFIALEIAIGAGALYAGWYFASDVARIPMVFNVCAVSSVLGWVYLQFFYRKYRDEIN
jgi:MFS family permease